ncbi:hypothetical protein EJ110_NYTH23725 [Nymphaea thermarum]|nr:hypothetical protein EJ110_NYTH23725 [Nymphaea thermarum]
MTYRDVSCMACLMQVEWTEDAGYITIGNTNYNMEMHMVHRSVDGRIAVIGIPYRIGLLSDKFLGEVTLNRFLNAGR